ncbi:MAG: ornithine carbamoyltransferase [Proteobacteria bacterium]|nr:ornithine carbamoyltransferase [Pseudomonadota bacterium]
MSEPRHFLDIDALDSATLRGILDHAVEIKRRLGAGERWRPLDGTTLGMIFEAPSTRTRVSFEVGMRQLGGHTVMLSPADTHLGRGESIADTARVLSRYVDVLMIRTTSHDKLLELARHASVPVINGLTDRTHPCQLMADVMTFEEHLGPIAGKAVAWAGDGNNMAVSWIHAAVRFGFRLRLACPDALRPPAEVLAWAVESGGDVAVSDDVEAMVSGADCICADTWVSMSTERGDVNERLLEPYRVDDRMMGLGKPDAIFMHCLPAYRGREVTASVIDGPRSVVWDEAENRLHAQKGILAWCLGV